MRALFAVLPLLVLSALGASPAAAAPIELKLIWEPGPTPWGVYTACDGAKPDLDFCIPAGTWIGLCGKSPVSGTVALDDKGHVRFSGCAADLRLLVHESAAKERGYAAKAAVLPDAPGCGIGADGFSGAMISVAGKQHFARVVHPGPTLETWPPRDPPGAGPSPPATAAPAPSPCADFSRLGKGSTRTLDLPTAGLPTGTHWGVTPIGDLNGDGRAEFAVWSLLDGFSPAIYAALWSPADKGSRILFTVTTPTLYLSSPEQRLVHGVTRDLQSCDHWGGEEPYDEARAKDIIEGQKRDCARYRQSLEAAKKLYPANAALKALPTGP